MAQPLMILVAGPYRSGTNDDPALIAANVRAMTAMALRLFRLRRRLKTLLRGEPRGEKR